MKDICVFDLGSYFLGEVMFGSAYYWNFLVFLYYLYSDGNRKKHLQLMNYHFERHCFSDLVPTLSATAAQDIPAVM